MDIIGNDLSVLSHPPYIGNKIRDNDKDYISCHLQKLESHVCQRWMALYCTLNYVPLWGR